MAAATYYTVCIVRDCPATGEMLLTQVYGTTTPSRSKAEMAARQIALERNCETYVKTVGQ